MQELDDHALLREYADHNSEEAFATLVARHVSKVYSVALRHTGNPHQAAEITQAVFVILAGKSRRLGPRVILEGWLYQTARLTALTLIRGEIRRARREQEAHLQTLLNENEAEVWTQIAPLLDTAMAGLSESDRHAVVLRFFYGRSTKEVGVALGGSEGAARLRLHRAVEKLRRFFRKRGVTSTSEAIAGAISAYSVQAAPATLAKSVTVAAVAKGAAAGGSTLPLVKGALKVMAWTKAKTAVVASVGLLVAAGTTTAVIYNANKPVPIQGIPKDWSVLSGNGEQWNWTNNTIYAESTNGESILASNRKYGDATISATLGSTNRDAELLLRVPDAENGYHVIYTPDDTPWAAENGSILKLVRKIAGEEMDLAEFKRRKLPHFAKITASARGTSLEVRLNDVLVIRTNDTTFASGFIGLRVYGDPVKPSACTFSNLTVQ